MKTYAEFRPTSLDCKGLGCDDRQEWLVAPVGTNRDADALTRSNFRVMLAGLGGESEDVEVHRFGHWACGWFEICLVRPDTAAAKSAEEWEACLSDYPIASENDFSREEDEEAQQVWSHCYSTKQRIAYIRDNRSQFEFCSFADMLSCVRGNYFCGCASELLA